MRKKQRHGGLSPHHVRLIRKYLETLYAPKVPQAGGASRAIAANS